MSTEHVFGAKRQTREDTFARGNSHEKTKMWRYDTGNDSSLLVRKRNDKNKWQNTLYMGVFSSNICLACFRGTSHGNLPENKRGLFSCGNFPRIRPQNTQCDIAQISCHSNILPSQFSVQTSIVLAVCKYYLKKELVSIYGTFFLVVLLSE